ncbi:MAG: PspC domain-containing protein [Fibromonadaceae bacterium]|jgi:phage shock protein PspC (stress-responsive transcriptional regulator)|nr:PspC domain-containing protein [Fibromonadaceae bacterium]
MKALRLPKANKKLFGVCAAFANSFGIDATLVRVIWACTVLFAGTGILAYLLCWLIIPNEE